MAKLPSSMQKLFLGIDDGVCACDARCRILYLNPAAERLLGVSLEQAAGKSLCGLLCGGLSGAGRPHRSSRCPLLCELRALVRRLPLVLS